MKSSEVLQSLKASHKPREWVFLEELRIGTGYIGTAQQRIDAFAVNCYESKGFTKRAYEIKVSRSDWLRELKQDNKRVSAMNRCNEFYFVCPENMIDVNELPVECGLIYVNPETNKIRTVKKAQYHECVFDEKFYVSLIRHMSPEWGAVKERVKERQQRERERKNEINQSKLQTTRSN